MQKIDKKLCLFTGDKDGKSAKIYKINQDGKIKTGYLNNKKIKSVKLQINRKG